MAESDSLQTETVQMVAEVDKKMTQTLQHYNLNLCCMSILCNANETFSFIITHFYHH